MHDSSTVLGNRRATAALSLTQGQEPRAQQVARAADAIQHGASVEVSGPPGCGRSAFLHAVRARLESRGWHTVAVAGVPALRSKPFGALIAWGALEPDSTPPLDVRTAVDQVAAKLPSRRAVAVADDTDDLDDSSAGVLDALRSVRRTPVIWARCSLGGDARFSVSHDVVTIPLTGLRFDEFLSVLDTRLEHPVDSSTAARIYAQTAGRPGLALAALEAAVRERRLIVGGDRLSGVGGIWSPALSRTLRALVEPLDETQRDLLTLLALLGDTAIETAEALCTGDELGELEELGLLRIHELAGRVVVTVDPPLLGDQLRRTTPGARRRRLLRLARDAAPAESASVPETGPAASAAEFVQGLHDSERALAQDAAEAWTSAQTAETAAGYVGTLLRSASGRDADIDAALHASSGMPMDDDTHASWAVAEAYNRAYLHGEPAEALAGLKVAAERVGRRGGFVRARAAEIETELLGAPDLSLLEDPSDSSLSADVRAATHRAVGYAHLVGGRVGLASHHLAAARGLQGGRSDPVLDHLEAFAGLAWHGGGEVTAAQQRFAAARRALDPVSFRLHGSVLAFGALADGLHAGLDDLLGELALLGGPSAPPPVAPSAALSATIMAAVAASRAGNRVASDRLDTDLRDCPLPDGPLPGMQRAWVQAQAELCAGEPTAAARTLDATAQALWVRGARLAAAYAWLAAIEIEPTRERYDGTIARIRTVEGQLVGSGARYVAALVEQAPDALIALGDAFADEERYSLALAAYARAADLHSHRQNPAGAAAARARSNRLEQTIGAGRYEPHRLLSARVELTAREHEIAKLAGAGLSNRQIADELVLSTRTVESHLHRAMRKLGIDRRTQLGERMEETQADWG